MGFPKKDTPAGRAFAKLKEGKKPKHLKHKKRLRRVSKRPTKALIDRTDRALQDYFRATYPGKLCEGCEARPFELMHHFVEKSQSASLRYDHDNLIFLCEGCHYRHHRTGDQRVMSNVILNRGEEWHKTIYRRGKQEKRGPYFKDELEAILNHYKQLKSPQQGAN